MAVHRHEQRRRRRQEGALHLQLRAVRQRRAPAGVPLLGNGQLALQHGERVPRAVDAERRRPRADWPERRAVGRHAGQRRQDVVPGRRERPARRTSSFRSTTAASRSPISSRRISSIPWGAPVRDRRHAAGNARRADAGRIAQPGDGRGRQRRLSRRPPAHRSHRRLHLRRAGRPHRPAREAGRDRRTDATQERLPLERVHQVDRPALPPGRHGHRARRHALHRRHVSRHHPAGDVVGPGNLPARPHRSVRARQGLRPRPHLAAHATKARSATARSRGC